MKTYNETNNLLKIILLWQIGIFYVICSTMVCLLTTLLLDSWARVWGLFFALILTLFSLNRSLRGFRQI